MKLVWVLVRTKLHQEEAVLGRVQALAGVRAVLPRVGGGLGGGDCFGPADLAMTGNAADLAMTETAVDLGMTRAIEADAPMTGQRPKPNDLLFPGYAFIGLQVQDDDIHTALTAVKQVAGITRVVVQGKTPVTIPNTWLETWNSGLPSPGAVPSELAQLANIPSSTKRTMALMTLLGRRAVEQGQTTTQTIRPSAKPGNDRQGNGDNSRRSA